MSAERLMRGADEAMARCEYGQAKELYRQAFAASASPQWRAQALAGLADALLREGDAAAEAAKFVTQALAELAYETSLDALRLKDRCLKLRIACATTQGFMDAAVNDARERLAHLMPDSPAFQAAKLDLAMMLLEAKRGTEALLVARECLAAEVDDPMFPLVANAYAARDSGEHYEAMVCFERLLTEYDFDQPQRSDFEREVQQLKYKLSASPESSST